jgi:hypothetical protein
VQKVLDGEMTDPSLTRICAPATPCAASCSTFCGTTPASTTRRCWRCPTRATSRRSARLPPRRCNASCGGFASAPPVVHAPIHSWDEFERTVNFFVDTANTYHSHFLLLPELFTAQLFTLMPPDLDSRAAIRRLASHDRPLYRSLQRPGGKHGLYIIAGSQPELRDGDLYNVAISSRRAAVSTARMRCTSRPSNAPTSTSSRATRSGLRHAAGAHRHPGRLRCRVPGGRTLADALRRRDHLHPLQHRRAQSLRPHPLSRRRRAPWRISSTP